MYRHIETDWNHTDWYELSIDLWQEGDSFYVAIFDDIEGEKLTENYFEIDSQAYEFYDKMRTKLGFLDPDHDIVPVLEWLRKHR